MLFVARENQLLLKIKKLIVFKIINLKWIKTINEFLVTGDKLHLKLPGFSYSAFGPFTKHRERIQKF